MNPPESLTSHQIVDLLTVTASYDQRTVGEDDVKAWLAAAHRARWDYQTALTAIIDHYTNRTERITPGHVTQTIRAHRQDAAMRRPVEPPDPAGQARVTQAISGAFQTIGEDRPLAPWQQAVTAAKQEAKQRRERVLRYPDIAAKLTHPPLNLANPTMWNGYIPPRTLPSNDDNPYDEANQSPIRQQLVAIAADALRRGVPA